MIAVDTNILVYAHRRDTPWHAAAVRVIRTQVESRTPWAIPWPCVHEFLSVVTHPRVFDPPSSPEMAFDQLEFWLGCPGVVAIGEGSDHVDVLRSLVVGGAAQGPQVHDARIAAICVSHGVSELWTADRDFSRFPAVRVRNPLASGR